MRFPGVKRIHTVSAATNAQSPQTPSAPAPLAARGALRGASRIRRTRTAEARAELSDLRGGLHQRFAARQRDRCKRNKIERSCKPERECSRNHKHSLFSSVQIVENPKVFKRAAVLLLGCASRAATPATSSRRLDTALLCAAKKRGVENPLEGFCQKKATPASANLQNDHSGATMSL